MEAFLEQVGLRLETEPKRGSGPLVGATGGEGVSTQQGVYFINV